MTLFRAIYRNRSDDKAEWFDDDPKIERRDPLPGRRGSQYDVGLGPRPRCISQHLAAYPAQDDDGEAGESHVADA